VALKVLLADDHKLVLAGIRRSLEDAEGIKIVGEAHSASQVLPLVAQTGPDMVLLDIRLPDGDGFACLDRIHKRYPKVKVVMLSAFSDPEHIETALKKGATAFIVKSVNPLDLASALRQAVEGNVYHAHGLSESDDDSVARRAGLTEREISMLKALAKGLSNQAISREFWVTEPTVKFHLTNIYRKLGVANRTEAARHAYSLGLVER
jgi:DNA-binding NarL/FixJ family response regulator